ncbi:MAG: nitroreductase family protein, partial [Chloroflexota bacterium]|nr:nitroreductase family protein [Chloroflexota bacterium]
VPDELIEKALEAARWAMSGGNAQPWEFIVVKNRETKRKLMELVLEKNRYLWDIEKTRIPELRHPAYRQFQDGQKENIPTESFGDAPVFIMVCGDPRTVQATVLGAQFLLQEGGAYAHFLKNVANATMILQLAIAAGGLASQWTSLSATIEPRIKELLNVPPEIAVHTLVPVGYPAYQPAPGVRRELKDIVHYEKYDRAKYRSGDDIFNFLVELRRRTRPNYPPDKKASPG